MTRFLFYLASAVMAALLVLVYCGDSHAVSFFEYCVARLNGESVNKEEVELSKWYYKAADRGDSHAECCIASHYATGRGVDKDYAEALRWYRKAAERKNSDAQYKVGIFYASGFGVARDCVEAAKWYLEAAVQGNSNA